MRVILLLHTLVLHCICGKIPYYQEPAASFTENNDVRNHRLEETKQRERERELMFPC